MTLADHCKSGALGSPLLVIDTDTTVLLTPLDKVVIIESRPTAMAGCGTPPAIALVNTGALAAPVLSFAQIEK